MERFEREDSSLLHRQWQSYAETHSDKANLAVHAVAVPVFMAGTCVMLASPWHGVWWTVVGVGMMVAAMAVQGRAHRHEGRAPAPFRGAVDVVSRILTEQWITFPRYVLSGAFGVAWRHTRIAPDARSNA